MIGSRVWIWFNGKPTVEGQVLDNFYDRALPLVPKVRSSCRPTGRRFRFRNIYVREIPVAEAKPRSTNWAAS